VNDGLCSKCYKDALKRKQAAPTSSSVVSSASSSNYSPSIEPSSTCSSMPLLPPTCTESNLNAATPTIPSAIVPSAQYNSSKAEVGGNVAEKSSNLEKVGSDAVISQSELESQASDAPKEKKKKKTRCTKCRVNVGVIGFPCRCGGMFCSTHRYANEHCCSFDYKEHGAEEIRKNNPQVVGEKIQKI